MSFDNMNQDQNQIQQQDRVQQLLERLGKAYLDRHEYADAYEKYSQLLDISPDNKLYLLNTAISSIGMGRVSKNALELYEKAIAKNGDSDALKIGLATLFMQHNISTPFAVHLCEAAARISPPPPNSHKIRLFLKEIYEETGNTRKLNQIEHEVVFSTQNIHTIRSYLEGLWWEGKFDEAEAAIKRAKERNYTAESLDHELLLTHAYKHYYNQATITDTTLLEKTHRELENLDITISVSNLKKYLLLRSILPRNTDEEDSAQREVEEYEFILGEMSLEDTFKTYHSEADKKNKNNWSTAFDFKNEVLDLLEKPDGVVENVDTLYKNFRAILFFNVRTQNQKPLPDKLSKLISKQLSKTQDTILRQAGTEYLCIGREPHHQLETLMNLLQHLDEYNAAISAKEKVSTLGAISIIENGQLELGDKKLLDELVTASHLYRLVTKLSAENAGATGSLILKAGNNDIKSLQRRKLTLLDKGKVRLLPGLDAPYSEIIWRNSLNLLEKGQKYKINRFDLQTCLVKHNQYATYKAIDTQLDRPVIVKIMSPQNTVAILQNPAERDELFEKLRAIGRINHPSIANLYDMGEHNNMIYFVREYIEGEPVTEHRFTGEQRENEILNVLHTLLRALITSQRQGIAHLNLKSGNIWLSDAQQLKVTDFYFTGFSEDFTRAKILYPAQWHNIAPEILAGEIGDFRSDIYSLGILAYEIISGHHPYKTTASIHSPKDILKTKILPLQEHETAHNSNWDAFVMKALNTNPDERFQTFNEMELELRKIQMQLMQQALHETAT